MSADQPAAPTPVAAHPRSALSGLRARREAAQEQAFFDLPVPVKAMDGIFVRFEPVEQAAIDEANAWIRKNQKVRDRQVIAEARVIADACRGVLELVDGHKVSVDSNDRGGDPPQIGPELAQLLGMDEPNPLSTDIVRALYVHDGPLRATYLRLTEKSGFVPIPLDDEVTDRGE